MIHTDNKSVTPVLGYQGLKGNLLGGINYRPLRSRPRFLQNNS